MTLLLASRPQNVIPQESRPSQALSITSRDNVWDALKKEYISMTVG
jgi:hypothetical protein